jgi:hypothetical protein
VRKLILALMLSVLLLGFGTAMAATSQIDNLPGGAGVSFWQAGAGWQTVINVQNTSATTALCIHVALYDADSVHLGDWLMSLTPLDNVGIVLNPGSAAGNINILDYSDNAAFPGCTNTINDYVAGVPLSVPAPADATGLSRGYMTVAITAADNTPPLNDPIGSPFVAQVSGNFGAQLKALLPNMLLIRHAELTANAAYAGNSPMLQDFLNQTTLSEVLGTDFVDTWPAVNPFTACNWNADAVVNLFNDIDDPSGINIDFWEMFLSEHAVAGAEGIVCDQPVAGADVVYVALGSLTGQYWARYNENPTAGANTILNVISPNSTRIDTAAIRFPRSLSIISYNDQETPWSWGPNLVPEVAGLQYGTAAGEILTGGSLSGESLITFLPPAFGHTYTETASFADLYPLVRTNVGITAINRTGVDRGAGVSDVISIP